MLRRGVAVGMLGLLSPGCAHHAEWSQRQPAVESTIGNDPNQAPAGRVIRPPGLGVDLGDRSHDDDQNPHFGPGPTRLALLDRSRTRCRVEKT